MIIPASSLILEGRQPEALMEELSKRGRNFKVFDLGSGKHRLRMTSEDLHWFDATNQKWFDIDLTPSFLGNKWSVIETWYELEVSTQFPEIFYESKGVGILNLTIQDFGGPLTLNDSIVLEPDVQIRFDEIRPDLDLIYNVRPKNFRMIKVLKSATAPTSFVVEIDQDVDLSAIVGSTIIGFDSKYGIPDPSKPPRPVELTRVESTRTSVRGGAGELYTVTETFTGRAWEITDPATRTGAWLTDIVYPVTIYG